MEGGGGESLVYTLMIADYYMIRPLFHMVSCKVSCHNVSQCISLKLYISLQLGHKYQRLRTLQLVKSLKIVGLENLGMIVIFHNLLLISHNYYYVKMHIILQGGRKQWGEN